MTGLKLGKRPAVRPHGLADLAVYAKGKLPEPPASVPVPSVADWGMMDNDRLGCCTISGAGHLILATSAEVSGHELAPTDSEIEQQYFEITGGEDSGCVEAEVLKLWHTQGLFAVDSPTQCSAPDKIAGYAPVNPKDVTAVHQAVAFYGACYIGVALPESAQQQFGAGQPWTVVPGSPIEGGHCIVLVSYDSQYVQAVTWGAVVNVSYPWLQKYMDEAWAVIPSAFVEAGRGPELDMDSLLADLSSV